MKFPYIIGEIGINHNNSKSVIKTLIQKCAASGFSAVKFQLFKAEELVKPVPISGRFKKGRTLVDVFKEFELDEKLLSFIDKECVKNKIHSGYSVFSLSGVKKAASFKSVKFLKIASCDLKNIPLIEECLKTRLDVVISTGLADLKEIKEVYKKIKKYKNQISFLHCVSCYPPSFNDLNLSAVETLGKTFKAPVGFSDHTEEIYTAALSVMKGALLIEKHITLSKKMKGPDQKLSLEVKDFPLFIRMINDAYASIGSGVKKPAPSETKETIKNTRRGIYAARDLKIGEKITPREIKFLRPEASDAFNYEKIKNKKTARALKKDSPVYLKDIC